MGLETILAIGSAVMGVAGTATSILTRPGSPKPPEVPRPEDPMKAAYAEMEAMRKRKGAVSTILTGPQGLGGPATTTKTQLGA